MLMTNMQRTGEMQILSYILHLLKVVVEDTIPFNSVMSDKRLIFTVHFICMCCSHVPTHISTHASFT